MAPNAYKSLGQGHNGTVETVWVCLNVRIAMKTQKYPQIARTNRGELVHQFSPHWYLTLRWCSLIFMALHLDTRARDNHQPSSANLIQNGVDHMLTSCNVYGIDLVTYIQSCFSPCIHLPVNQAFADKWRNAKGCKPPWKSNA